MCVLLSGASSSLEPHQGPVCARPPSAVSQVAKLQEAVAAGAYPNPIEAWKAMKFDLVASLGDLEAGGAKSSGQARQLAARENRASHEENLLRTLAAGGARPTRLSDCHDFSWSRGLWRTAAMQTLRVAGALTLAYVALGWYFLIHWEGMPGLWGWYFLSATLSTVGFGDVAPTLQATRLAAVFLVPMGLVIIGFLLSFQTAYLKSLKPRFHGEASDTPEELERRALFEALDQDGDGILTLEEMVSGAPLLHMTADQAAALYEDLAKDKNGEIRPPPRRPKPWHRTVPGRCAVLLLQMYGAIFLGALFFKSAWFPEDAELGLTWVDAWYFATVTATSIGYGDIVPATDAGRAFMIVYMLVATVVVGGVLTEFIDVYTNEVVGEGIIRTLIDSTTWVHKADIDNNGTLTESDYGEAFSARGGVGHARGRVSVMFSSIGGRSTLLPCPFLPILTAFFFFSASLLQCCSSCSRCKRLTHSCLTRSSIASRSSM